MAGAEDERIVVGHGGECIPYTGRRGCGGGVALAALDGLDALDAAALAVLGLALARGLWIGLVREAFSLLALAGACVAVRFGLGAAATALAEASPWPLEPLAAKVLAGALLALGAALAVVLIGRLVRRSLHAVGLGTVDRVGGGLLGAAEGALLVAVLLLGATALLGPRHPWLADSQAVRLLTQARGLEAGAGDVAAPPPASGAGERELGELREIGRESAHP